MASWPGPPFRTSSPKMSVTRSSPSPPMPLSLPEPPSRLSLPPLPRSVSSPSLEMIRSLTFGPPGAWSSTPLKMTCSPPLNSGSCRWADARAAVALVVLGVLGSSDRAAGDAEVVHVEHELRPREDVGGKALSRGVALNDLGERVGFELWQQVQAVETLQVVEAVGVLQVLHLDLEDVVERRAQHAAEWGGALGQTTHPQVDVIDTGGGAAVGVIASSAGLFRKSSASRGTGAGPVRDRLGGCTPRVDAAGNSPEVQTVIDSCVP